MKALFIYPELCQEFRYGDWLEIGTAAALLRKSGWQVEGYCWKSPRLTEELQRRFRELEPDLAITLIQPDQATAALMMFQSIKAHRPQTITIACGIWPTLDPDSIFVSGFFDVLIVGDWEIPLAEFARAIDSQADYTGIPSVWVKVRPGDIRKNPPRPTEVSPDTLPVPDRDLFPYREAMQINGGEIPMRAGRACPFQCGFCHEPLYAKLRNNPGNPQRVRSPHTLISEASELANRFAPKRFVFVDPVFPVDEDWLKKLGSQWARHIHIPFTVTGVTEQLTPAVLERLHRAGCDRIIVGVETGDEQFRRTLSDRNVGNASLLQLRRQLDALAMEMITTNMIGLPGEKPSQLEATLELNQSLDPLEIRTRVYVPVPQTPLANYIAQHRIEVLSRPSDTSEPDISFLKQSGLTQEQISHAYDRLCLLDSVLRARRFARNPKGYYDLTARFVEGKFRSPWRRAAALMAWRSGNDTREVLALRAPAEMTFDFEARLASALLFGLTMQPTLRGLRPTQAVHFSIKITQDDRTLRLFRKVLIPALDPDARRWHDYMIPLRDIRPGPCRLSLQVWIDDKDIQALAPTEEIWGGWSNPHLIDNVPQSHNTPIPLAEAEGGVGALILPGAADVAGGSDASRHASSRQGHKSEQAIDSRFHEELETARRERDELKKQLEEMADHMHQLREMLAKSEQELAEAQGRQNPAEEIPTEEKPTENTPPSSWRQSFLFRSRNKKK